MSCDSTDRRRAHQHAQTVGERLERQSAECICDCAVVESLKGNGMSSEITSSGQASNIININSKRR